MAKRFEAKIEANQPWLDFVRRVPNVPGCYALFNGGLLIYVGSSLLMYQRLKDHDFKAEFAEYGVDRLKIWPIQCDGLTTQMAKEKLVKKEFELIFSLKPLLNKKGRYQPPPPEGFLRCTTCHELKSVHVFPSTSSSKCCKCLKEKNQKSHIKDTTGYIGWTGISMASKWRRDNAWRRNGS